MDREMNMPDLAATGGTINVVKWLIRAGRPVRRGQPLLEVETDKAKMEVESALTGVLKRIVVEAGDEVSAGQPIAIIEVAGETEVPVEQTTGHTGGASREATPPEPATTPPAVGSDRTEPRFARDRRRAPQKPEPLGDRAKKFDRAFLLGLYERMVLIRNFEDGVKYLFLEGSMPGTIHQCQGQEATAVGVCAALNADDFITSTFRGHGHALAKGLSPQEVLNELFGAVAGCCKGKGGSMHIGNMDKGMVAAIAIVGGSVPLAAGMALAFKMRKTSQVVACFFGDGATSEGAFYEGINLAAIWDLPAIFVCENNLYGASTRIDTVARVEHVADRAPAFGIRGEMVDGNDVLAVYDTVRTAASECRSGEGPVLLELLTYRRTGHSRRDPGHYQPQEEKDYWFKRDPIELLGGALLERGDVSEPDLQAIRSRVEKEFNEAVEKARRMPAPDITELETDVFA